MYSHFILRNGKPVPATLIEWGLWFERSDERFIERTEIGQRVVSTVFLGISHGLDEQGRHLLFETMVFPNEDDWMERYATLGEAKQGHYAIVESLRANLEK